ncbi:hypothetical protein N9954_09070, partial [Maribacter sp.]|nr:hypothetical protein [Maribacter sp.]
MKTVSSKRTSLFYYHSNSKVILIAFFSFFICSCSNDDNQPTVKEEEPPAATKEISEEIKGLIYFKGDEKARTVLINVQAGPADELDTQVVDLIVDNFNTTDILTVNVHQVQTLTPSIVLGDDITLDQAVNFNSETIETLSKVISYFKNQGRTVNVLGLSFGAFVTQDLIAKKGIATADKYLLISGRLDMNDVMWQASSEGREGFFENGITPMVDSEPVANVKERNLIRLAAGFARNRYTQLLNSIEDLSNLTYIYG